MHLIKAAVAMAILSATPVAFAGSAMGTITSVSYDGTFGYVNVSIAKSSNPACSTGAFQFAMNFTVGNTNLAFYDDMKFLLDIAQKTGSTVTLVGDGTCTFNPNVENLVSVEN